MHCAVAILKYDNRHPIKTHLSVVRSTTISAASALIVIGCRCRKHGQTGSLIENWAMLLCNEISISGLLIGRRSVSVVGCIRHPRPVILRGDRQRCRTIRLGTFGTTCRRAVLDKVFLALRSAGAATLLFQRCALPREAPRPRSNQTSAFGRFAMGLQETKPPIASFRSDGSFTHHVCGYVEVRSRSRYKPCCPSGIGSDIHLRSNSTVGAAGTPYQFLVNEFAIRTAVGWRISSVVPVPAQ